jgi:UDP-N-acetylmuramoyl-tripeptide--D-alanyl-D-alanine ligase
MARVVGAPIRRVTFGESSGADVRAVDVIDQGFDGVRARVVAGTHDAHMQIPLPGRANLSNVLAAIGVAMQCGLGLETLVPAVGRLRPVARRGASYRLGNGVRVVDDSYNASPAALDAALSALAATPVGGRRVAVVGEMLELGDAAEALHEACGRRAVEAGVTLLVAVGGAPVDALVRGAVAAGLPREAIHRFTDSATAAQAIGQLVDADDVVLVKGSRGTRTELVVDQLMAVA